MRISAAVALALSLFLPVPRNPPATAPAQTPAVQAPAAAPVTGSSRIWIGRYEEFEKFLRDAPITKMEDIGTGVTLPKHAFFAPGGIAGGAVVKSIDDGLTRPWLDSYKSEIAAYRLDRALEMDMVPPTVERLIEGDTRSVQLWVENTRSLKKVSAEPKPDVDLWNQQVYRHRVFDDLITNIDRNEGNMLIDPAWNLILIDHSRAFDARKDKLPFALTKIDRPMFERLKRLDKKTLEPALRRYLTFGVDPILKQRDRIVKEFEQLIAKNGEANVLIDWKPLPGTAPTTSNSRQ